MDKSIILIMGCLTGLIILTFTPSGVAVIPINEAVDIEIPAKGNYTDVFHIDPNPIDIEIELNISTPYYYNIIIAKAKYENETKITSSSQIVLSRYYLVGNKSYKFSLNTTNSTYIVRIDNLGNSDIEGILSVWVEYGPARIDVFKCYLGFFILLVVIIVAIALFLSIRGKR